MAGPRPFHNAATPSAAMVFLAQSRKPLYVPVGADWILDFSTCKQEDSKNLGFVVADVSNLHLVG